MSETAENDAPICKHCGLALGVVSGEGSPYTHPAANPTAVKALVEEVLALRGKVDRVEAVARKWARPLDGARQRANTGDDFREIGHTEHVRFDCARDLRAALGDPA